MRECSDLDPEAVLRVSFLRGLRVLRAKLRRRDACLQTAKCRSLDSLRSHGMTTSSLLEQDDRATARGGVFVLKSAAEINISP